MADLTLRITADTVAWYAAIVATVSAIIAGYSVWKDKAKVKITLSKNMEILPSEPETVGKSFIVIDVANIGRRPITITHVGFYEIGKKEGGLLGDSFTKGPREIHEGKSTSYLMDQSLIDIKKLKTVIAIDATGKTYKKKISRKFRKD